MPACFALTKKGETKPTKLTQIDEELCIVFNAPVDPDKWYQNWYNTIGLGLALGYDWNSLREKLGDDPETKGILDWLEAHYEVDSWRE